MKLYTDPAVGLWAYECLLCGGDAAKRKAVHPDGGGQGARGK